MIESYLLVFLETFSDPFYIEIVLVYYTIDIRKYSYLLIEWERIICRCRYIIKQIREQLGHELIFIPSVAAVIKMSKGNLISISWRRILELASWSN